jgi:hypothetical protein
MLLMRKQPIKSCAYAGLAIVKQPGTISTEAPDHIMRLFAYHHLLQQYALQEWIL